MTNGERLNSYQLSELYNHTEHLNRLVECARVDAEHGDFAEAAANLRLAERPAGLVEMLLRDAKVAAEKAAKGE